MAPAGRHSSLASITCSGAPGKTSGRRMAPLARASSAGGEEARGRGVGGGGATSVREGEKLGVCSPVTSGVAIVTPDTM